MTASGGPSALVLFGKHPAWPDHMSAAVPASTSDSAAWRSAFYDRALVTAIDQARWAPLGDASGEGGFGHLFAWHSGPSLLLGRMWSSSDAVGRRRYPLIAAFHLSGIPAPAYGVHLFGLLAGLERDLCRATDQPAVHACLQAGFRAAAPAGGADPSGRWPGAPEWAALPALWLVRLLHHLDAGPGPVERCRHFRLPSPCAEDAESVLAAWALAAALVPPDRALAVFRPRGGPHVDVVEGSLADSDLLFLKAGATAIPLTTDIPYGIDAALERTATGLLASWASSAGWPVTALSSRSAPRRASGPLSWLRALGRTRTSP